MPRFSIKIQTAFALVLAGSFFVLNLVFANTDISTSTTWTKEQSPIVLSEITSILESGSLTIEPGVVVKFYEDIYLGVAGEFIAQGTADEPIIFTSIKDDNFAGDTNEDGDSTIPASGDWAYLGFGTNATHTIEHMIVRYGGRLSGVDIGAIKINSGGVLSIKDSTITENASAINNSGFLTINNSNIYNNDIPWVLSTADAGIANNGRAEVEVDAANNWWNTQEGPCPWRQMVNEGANFMEIPDLCGSRPLVDLGVIYDPWLSEEYVFGVEEEAEEEPEEPAEPEAEVVEPVIFIPGIAACINLKVLADIEDSSYDWEIFGNYYEALIKTFESAGFVKNENLFIACYDWRKTNGYNSDEAVNSGEEYLTYWIDRALENSTSTKVDIVAHSMGGLIARSYIQSERYRDDINNFVMVGTPNYGSSNSYYAWEGGEIPDDWDLLQRNILKSYLFYMKYKEGYINNKETIQNKIPSLKELLPTYDYTFKDDIPVLTSNNLLIEQNNFLKSLNEIEEIEKLTQRVNNATIIYGDNTETLESINVTDQTLLDVQFNKWVDGRPTGDITTSVNGDGTVLKSSAIIENIATSSIISGEHSSLPDEAITEIFASLGLEYETIYNTADISEFLVILVASPIDPVITSPDGKEVSKDNNGITGAQYFSAGDSGVKIISIPNPTEGDYSLSLNGNGNGSYNTASLYFSQNGDITSETSGSVSAGEEVNYNFSMQSGQLPNLSGFNVISEDEQDQAPVVSGGSIPLYLLEQMSENNKKEAKVLGLKIYEEDENKQNKNEDIFRAGIIYSEKMEDIIYELHY